jgi:hypothetical protein
MRLTRGLICAVLACVLSFVSYAYAELVKGRDYSVIEPAQPVSSGRKIEVLEFFWYGCIHDERFFQVLDQLIAQAREEHGGK